jgi:hypothetical protein
MQKVDVRSESANIGACESLQLQKVLWNAVSSDQCLNPRPELGCANDAKNRGFVNEWGRARLRALPSCRVRLNELPRTVQSRWVVPFRGPTAEMEYTRIGIQCKSPNRFLWTWGSPSGFQDASLLACFQRKLARCVELAPSLLVP